MLDNDAHSRLPILSAILSKYSSLKHILKLLKVSFAQNKILSTYLQRAICYTCKIDMIFSMVPLSEIRNHQFQEYTTRPLKCYKIQYHEIVIAFPMYVQVPAIIVCSENLGKHPSLRPELATCSPWAGYLWPRNKQTFLHLYFWHSLSVPTFCPPARCHNLQWSPARSVSKDLIHFHVPASVMGLGGINVDPPYTEDPRVGNTSRDSIERLYSQQDMSSRNLSFQKSHVLRGTFM